MKFCFGLACVAGLSWQQNWPPEQNWQQPTSSWAPENRWEEDSRPSSWRESPPSKWTPIENRRPPTENPTLAGRPPSEQLQITKCRSAQNCEKCRQLNCFWDASGKITNRCIALGLEAPQIPIDKGVAQNLERCPARGQAGFLGVNWLAIEASGGQVPNLEGMPDAEIQRWLSSIPWYDPDSTDVNYPAGSAFRDLLPSAASHYESGKIPSTTPWISFWDGLEDWDNEYYADGYSYEWDSWGAPFDPNPFEDFWAPSQYGSSMLNSGSSYSFAPSQYGTPTFNSGSSYSLPGGFAAPVWNSRPFTNQAGFSPMPAYPISGPVLPFGSNTILPYTGQTTFQPSLTSPLFRSEAQQLGAQMLPAVQRFGPSFAGEIPRGR